MLDAPAPTPRIPRPAPRPVPRTGPRVVAALIALAAAVGVHLTWHVFVNTAAGQRIDRLAFEGSHRGQSTLWSVAEPILDVVSIAFVVGAIGTVMVVALLRRRGLLALQVALVVGGANATTQLLKYVVYPRPSLLPGWTGNNSLPSGHTTVAASVAMAMLLACPRRWRPAVAVVGAIWTSVTGVSTLVGQWHRPSDVVAAVLVSLVWAAGACAFVSRLSLDAPGQAGEKLHAPGSWLTAGLMTLAGLAATFVAMVALVDLGTGVADPPFEGDITAYAGGIAAVLATSAIAFAVLLVVRQATARPRSA